MLKTEQNLRYRPRSLSYVYDRDKRRLKERPLSLHDVEQLLKQNTPLLEQDEIERSLDNNPKLPQTEDQDEERKLQILKDITSR